MNTYRISCACGEVLSGKRKAAQQVVICPRCRQRRFVLPKSPLPSVGADPSLPEKSRSRRYLWLMPPGAALLTASLLFLIYLQIRGPNREPLAEQAAISWTDHRQRVQGLMHSGSFRLAATEIEQAKAQRLFEAITPLQERSWRQMYREAALYADLCSEPLEDLLEYAASLPEDEWAADFAVRYRGKAILFDTRVWRHQSGFQMDLRLSVGHEPVRLLLDELAIFEQLDVDGRMIFGARLDSIRLEAPGPRWVVRFLPDSGVLLTDAVAASLCCPPWHDEQTQELLRRQASWE